MRVTSQMIFNQTIFNLARNLARYQKLETQLSTGRCINTPSDDPIGTQYSLRYRSTLDEIEQYLTNIQTASGRLATYEEGLNDLNNYFSDANQLAISMANDSNDADARAAAANEIDSILGQVLEIGNTVEGERCIYSGHRTRTTALEASANGVTYKGDNGRIEMAVNFAGRVKANLTGSEVFFKQLSALGSESDWHTAITADTLISDLNLGSGVESTPGTFHVVDNNGVNPDIDLNINVPPNATVGEVLTDLNNQLAANGNVLSVRIGIDGKSFEWVTGITRDTLLTNLNGGAGVDQSAPGTFRIRDEASAISIDVDISTATTMGDVIDAIQSALDGDPAIPDGSVTVALNTAGTGLEINDTNQPPLGLLVEDIGAGTKAADLGILGAIDPVLEGSALIAEPDFVITDIGSQTTGTDLGLLGRISANTTGTTVTPQLSADTRLTALNNGQGFTLGKIKISQGAQIRVIDLSNVADLNLDGVITVDDLIATINNAPGLNIQASINDARTGIQIVPTLVDPETGAETVTDVVDQSLIIENYDDSDDTARALGLEGSSDMIGSLMLLSTALRNNDQNLIGRLMENMSKSMQQLLAVRAEVGARMANLDTTENRLENVRVNVTGLLSEVEDADLITVASDLAQEENLYQAALLASARTIQMSLMDFLE